METISLATYYRKVDSATGSTEYQLSRNGMDIRNEIANKYNVPFYAYIQNIGYTGEISLNAAFPSEQKLIERAWCSRINNVYGEYEVPDEILRKWENGDTIQVLLSGTNLRPIKITNTPSFRFIFCQCKSKNEYKIYHKNRLLSTMKVVKNTTS